MTWTKPGEPISYASPLVITPKGDDDVRITADFRVANKGASRTCIVPGLRVDKMKVDEDSKKYLVVTSVADRQKRGKSPRKICYVHYCQWAHGLQGWKKKFIFWDRNEK
jgi:hypothetical protein